MGEALIAIIKDEVCPRAFRLYKYPPISNELTQQGFGLISNPTYKRQILQRTFS
jgi:hypothetical protein